MSLKKNRNEQIAPTFTIFSWMISALKLSKSELLIFAYLFDQTYDGKHKCYTSLDVMGAFFDCARQSVARNIEGLMLKGFVNKETTNDPINPIIKHNSYSVDIDVIAKLCIDAGYSEYDSFIKAYEISLRALHPDNVDMIDKIISHVQSLTEDNDDSTVNIRVSDLQKIIHMASGDYSGDFDIKEAFEKLIDSYGKLKNHNKRSYTNPNASNIQSQSSAQKQSPSLNKLLGKSKKTTRKTKREQYFEENSAKNSTFVSMYAKGNEDLLRLLNNYLRTDVGNKCDPVQWESKLDVLYDNSSSVSDMIENVKMAIANGSTTLFIKNKPKRDIDEKIIRAREYVDNEADGNEKLYDLLVKYITKTEKGKSFSLDQFNCLLDTLSNICDTTEDKVNSVYSSYVHNYGELAYEKKCNSQSSNSCSSDICIDNDSKISLIDKFISDGCYYLVDGLREALVEYITETSVGRSMDAETFNTNLMDFRIFCLKDSEKVSRVKRAIANNYTRLAMEDYAETKKIKETCNKRESIADEFDRKRKRDVVNEARKNPNNPLLADVLINV